MGGSEATLSFWMAQPAMTLRDRLNWLAPSSNGLFSSPTLEFVDAKCHIKNDN
jgi:hypothetical protein